MHPEAVVYGHTGYCNRHQEYYHDGMCYSCYMKENYCDFHGEYFCYECSQPGSTVGGGDSGDGGSPGGGGSGSGGDTIVVIPPGSGTAGYDNNSSSINIQNIVDENVGDSFQEADKAILVEILGQIKSDKIGNFIVQMIIDKNCWMNFEIGNTVFHRDQETGATWWSPAIYNAGTGTIIFYSLDDIGYTNLSEELAHAVQRSVYENEMNAANPNYEFEAKIIRDIMQTNASEQMNFDIGVERDSYVKFIYDIKDGKLSADEAIKQYKENYYNWNDPNGIKQKLTPDSPYYTENSQTNSFDPKLLKEVMLICNQNK